MANGVIPGGLRQRAVQLALQQQRPTDMSAMMAPGSIAGQVAAGTAMSPLSLRTMALRGATRPRTQAEVLKAYGLGAPSKLPQADVAAPTSAGIADTVASYLPTTGTPEMAGLGAAGRTMMQLGGWQDKPYTLGQILGAGAEKGLEAMKARQDAMAAAAEKRAAAERQSMLDAITIGEFNIKRRKDARDEAAAGQPTKPYEIYDVKTGRKKFVRDVRTESGGWTTEDVGGVAAEKETAEKVYGQKTVFDKRTKKSITVAENDPRIQLGGEFLDSENYSVFNTPQTALTAADIGFSEKTQDKLQDKTITLDMTLDNISELNRLFKAEYQIVPQKARYLLTLAAEKWGVKQLSPDEEAAMSGFVQLRQQANTTLNDYIKAITGAQMSVAEAGRLEKSIPKAGTGLFDGDSPTEFRAKLDQFGRLTKLARARAAYALKNGYKESRTEAGALLGFGKAGERPLTLDRMDQILVKETEDIAEDYMKANKDMSRNDALIQAKSIVEARYGINV